MLGLQLRHCQSYFLVLSTEAKRLTHHASLYVHLDLEGTQSHYVVLLNWTHLWSAGLVVCHALFTGVLYWHVGVNFYFQEPICTSPMVNVVCIYRQNLPCSKTACATGWQLVATAPTYLFSLRYMSSSTHIHLYKRTQSEETVPEKVRTHSLLFINEYSAAVRRRSRIQARCQEIKFQCAPA